jgi:FMN reductase (NADPH)
MQRRKGDSAERHMCENLCPVGASTIASDEYMPIVTCWGRPPAGPWRPVPCREGEPNVDFDDLMRLIRGRRSSWYFRSDPVPDVDIERIVDAARYAPSGFNSQLWEFVAITDPGLRSRVVEVVAASIPRPPQGRDPVPAPRGERGVPVKDPLGFRTAPVFILVLGDTRVRPYGPPPVRADDTAWDTVFTSSLAVAFEHMHLAAAALGLATRWVSASGSAQAASAIKGLLGIPEELAVYDMMALGHSDFEPLPKKLRPLSEVLHYNACGSGEFRSQTEVEEYFAGR